MNIRKVIKKVREYNPKADVDLISKAYEFANRVHGSTKRASGEPYIQHPLNAAYILAELKLDVSSIVASLLHDVVEDSNVSLETVKKEFGEEVASLVDGVTKISKLHYSNPDEADAETVRKMLMATTRDIRVIIIKLADKLHNMRTLKYLSHDKQVKVAKDALDIYAPLAYRLGIASIKWELEDIAFKYIQPETYQMFKKKFGKKRWQREIDIIRARRALEKELLKAGIKVSVSGRPKHFYSIYKKMVDKKRSFEELYDLMALRVITGSVKDCYEALGVIHNMWKPIPGEFKDYIAMPKSNMYQSLHTSVIGLDGQPIEIQIRTEEMHKTAEEGIAAHWQYKGVYGDDNEFDKKLSWLRQILDWQRDSTETKDFMDFLKVDFFEDEIYVFSPKGKVVALPRGSTPLDFAYSIHSSIGDTTTGAIVNGRIVPLRYELKNGDIIKIMTSKTAKPHRDWLKIVRTTKARDKIRHTIKQKEGIPASSPVPYLEVGDSVKGSLVYVPVKNAVVKLAKCCHPLPGDLIVGYITRSRSKRVVVHRRDCTNIRPKTSSVELSWVEDFNSELQLKVVADDRVGLFADVLNTVAATGTHVRNAKAKLISENLAECSFAFVPENTDHIKDMVNRVKRVQSVRKVFIANK
ncbi:MAG: bifunctional (p)ppGpp synthetase/guanosine-3',5'-bis(diphosphate) 3'-pyrophosphohydrolase [archaeon]